ncbi:MAG: hypothetical protein WBQ17_12270 [Rhizomicrobium sp.]
MANGSKRAPKTRARIIEINAKLSSKGATAPQILAAVRAKYPEVIRVEKDDLIDLGLGTILNSVTNLKGGSGSSVQIPLFPGFDLPRTVTLRGGLKKSFVTMTKGELRQYVADHTKSKAPPKRSSQIAEAARFYDEVKGYGDDGWIVAECWKAKTRDAA